MLTCLTKRLKEVAGRAFVELVKMHTDEGKAVIETHGLVRVSMGCKIQHINLWLECCMQSKDICPGGDSLSGMPCRRNLDMEPFSCMSIYHAVQGLTVRVYFYN